MGEKSTQPQIFIARGVDQRSAISNIPIGRAEIAYNFDTDTDGFIKKRTGYELHRNIPIRVTNVGDRGNNWEIVADPSIDLLGVPSGPIVINGQAINTNTGELESVNFYWQQFDNLGAFTLVGTPAGTIWQANITISQSNDLNLMAAIVRQDPNDTSNNEAVLINNLQNEFDNINATYQFNLEFESPVQFGNETYTLYSPDQNVVNGSEFYTNTTPVVGDNTFTITAVTHGLAGDNFIVQVWQDDGTGLKRDFVYPDEIMISGSGDVTVDFNVGTTNDVYVYLITVNDAYQTAAFIDKSTQSDIDNNIPKVFCLENVTTNTNLWALYRVDASGNQTFVVPDAVKYTQSTQELCFDFYPVQDSVFKAVYLPGLPVSAGVIVSKIDDSTPPIDTSIYDLPNADLALHGINWDGVVVSSTAPEFAFVREVDEYRSVALEKLTAVSGGDLWIDDLVTTYTATASQIAEQTAAAQYLTPYFGASALAIGDGRGRGINCDQFNNSLISVESITNNGDGTATFLSEIVTNITGSIAGVEAGIDRLTTTGAEYNVYNGEFTISAASIETDIDLNDRISITVTIPDLETYVANATGLITMGIFTDYIIMDSSNFDDLKIGDKINNLGGLLGSEVFYLDDVNYRMWLDPVTSERLFPGSVDVTWDRDTNVIFVNSVEGIVPQDVVRISGFKRRFKILSVDVANESVTINEVITVSNFFGAATQITLDGRLALPLRPNNNISKDFPFEPTGEYSTELAALNDSLYTTTYDRSVIKFDGTHISDAGIQEYPIYHHSWLVPKQIGVNEDEYGFISPNAIAGKITTVNLNVDIELILTDSIPSTLFLGQDISVESSDGSAIVDGTISSIDRDTDQLTIAMTDTSAFAGNNVVSVFEPTSFGYYFRIEYTDRNNKIIAGTPNSYVDAIVTITRPSVVMHCVKLPSTGNGTTEWDRLKVAMYRTVGAPSIADVTPIFYKVDDTPALKDLTGFQASDAQAIHTVVIADTTTDGSLAPGKNNTIIRSELRSGVNSGTDFISNAQISSLGGSALERPIAAARPPLSQYLLSTGGFMVYGNVKSQPELFTTWAKNSATIKNLIDTSVTLRATYVSVDYDITTKFVDSSSSGITVDDISSIHKSTAAIGSDFDNSANESEDVGFLKITTAGTNVVGANATRYCNIIAKDGVPEDYGNDFVGSLVGWHKVTKIDSNNEVYIRVPLFIAEEFDPSVSTSSLQIVLTTEDVIPIWDVAYADNEPNSDITLPSNLTSKATRNWSRAINTVMADNGYYARIAEEINSEPTTGGAYPPNYVLGDWGYTRWGQTVGSGNVDIRQQSTLDLTFRILYTNNPDGFEIFSNGFLSANPILGGEAVFPSRLVVSYQNYPESVDNPYADDQFKSFSVIDVNASDGQEITGLASFFSESSTGAAQFASTIIVFKTNSVYAVDIKTKQTQKLQSLGQGCTIPDSIARTDDTIFFANDNGVYKVTRDLNVKYVGDILDKYYKALDTETLKLRGYGIADNFTLNYKMAVPAKGSSINNEVMVYNFESMSKQAEGSWMFYDNIPMASAKQTTDKFWFGNFKGRIFQNRDAKNVTDYRDDDSPIVSSFTYGPQHFGDPGKTKDMSHTIVQFEGKGPSAVTASMALDLSENFTTLDSANIGEGAWKGVSIAYSPPNSKAVFYQIKLEHDVKDENCIINGLVFKVSLGNENKIRQAKDKANGLKN